MKLLIDQNLYREVAALLRSLGHDAVHTSELDMQRTEDIDLISYANSEGSVVVTRDLDFHELIARGSLKGPSTVLIRLPKFDPYTLRDLVDTICTRFEAELLTGSLITANGKTIRTRSLPLIRK